MCDERVETHVVVDAADAPVADLPIAPGAPDGGPGARTLHFQEWWVRLHAALPARHLEVVGLDRARPAPGVLEALRRADAVLLAPSNPVVSLGPVLGVPGLRQALRDTAAPVVGVSPVIGGHAVRGMAEACLATLGLGSSAAEVAGLFGDLLDGWLVDTVDAGTRVVVGPERAAPVVRALPLLMTDGEEAARIAGAALELALGLRR